MAQKLSFKAQIVTAARSFFAQFFNVNTSALEPTIGGTNTPVLIGTKPIVYAPPTTKRFVDDAFSGNASVYTIVSRIARKFGSIPRYLYQIEDTTAQKKAKNMIKQGKYNLVKLSALQKKAYEEHIIDQDNDYSKLLDQPNEYSNQDMFFELAVAFYMVTANCFIWLNRGLSDQDMQYMSDEEIQSKPVLEMFVLPTQYMGIIPDPNNVWGVLGYIFVINGQQQRIRKVDIIHWKMPTLKFDAITGIHLWGMSPLEPGNALLTEDQAATDGSVNRQLNDGSKGALVNRDMTEPTPEQRSAIDKTVNRKINNRNMRGAVAALQGDWSYLNMAQTGKDMESVDVRSAAFARLCNLMGVPPQIFLTDSTFNNVEAAEKAFLVNLIIPLCVSLQGELDRRLLPAFNFSKGQYAQDIDVSSLPELQTEMKDLVSTLTQAWWMTPNERRKEQNLEEDNSDENMNKYWIPTGMTLMEDAAVNDVIPIINGTGNINGADRSTFPPSPQGNTGKGDQTGLPNAKGNEKQGA